MAEVMTRYSVNEMDQSTCQLYSDYELHRETKCTAKIADKQQFGQVVGRRVDPSTALRKENTEGI
jgi:hypothetical protein